MWCAGHLACLQRFKLHRVSSTSIQSTWAVCSSQYKVAARTHTHTSRLRALAGDCCGSPLRRRRAGGGGAGALRLQTRRGRLDSFRHRRSVLKQQFLEGSFPVRAADEFGSATPPLSAWQRCGSGFAVPPQAPAGAAAGSLAYRWFKSCLSQSPRG